MSVPEIQTEQTQPNRGKHESANEQSTSDNAETQTEPSATCVTAEQAADTFDIAEQTEQPNAKVNTEVKTEVQPKVKSERIEVDPHLASQIINQVEFYFSNSNLPRDKYLLSFYESDPENMVPIPEIASFARMKKLTSDLVTVVSALEKSTKLRMNAQKTHITRIESLPNQINLSKSTIYIKGIPLSSTLDDISTKFSEWNAPVQCIRMLRQFDNKSFNGSAFIEFASEKMAKAFVEHKRKWHSEDENELIVMMRNDYFRAKKEQKETKHIDNNDQDKENQPEIKKRKAPTQLGPHTYKKDLLMKISTLPLSIDRDAIKTYVESLENVKCKFVDLPENSTSAVVRLKEDSTLAASEVIEKLTESKKEISKGIVPQLSVLTGEEEDKYWQAIFDRQDRREANLGKGRRGGKKQRC